MNDEARQKLELLRGILKAARNSQVMLAESLPTEYGQGYIDAMSLALGHIELMLKEGKDGE